MKTILTLSSLLIFHFYIFAEIYLHSIDFQSIKVPVNNKRFQHNININFNINNKTTFFICFSYGKQNNRQFHNNETELFKENKRRQEENNIRQDRVAFLKGREHRLRYQLYNSKKTPQILKNKLMANNKDDVLSAIIYPDSENPYSLQYFIETLDNFFDCPPGIYQDVFSIDLYKGDINFQQTATLLESKDIKIQFEVPYVSLIKEEAKLNDGSRCFYVNSNSRHKVSVSQVSEDKPKALEFVKMGPLITFTPDPNEKGYVVIEIHDLE